MQINLHLHVFRVPGVVSFCVGVKHSMRQRYVARSPIFVHNSANHLMSFVPLSTVYKFLKTGNVSKHPRYRITSIASHDTDALANEIGYWKI